MLFTEGSSIVYQLIILFLIMGLIYQKFLCDNYKIKNKIKSFCKEHELTEQECQIVSFIMMGYTSKKMAEIINRSEDTVKKHRANIHKKVEVSTVIELILKIINH